MRRSKVMSFSSVSSDSVQVRVPLTRYSARYSPVPESESHARDTLFESAKVIRSPVGAGGYGSRSVVAQSTSEGSLHCAR